MYLYLCFILSVIFVLSSCIYICVSYYQSYLSSHNLFVFVFHFIGHICPLILYLYFISHHVFVFVFHISSCICICISYYRSYLSSHHEIVNVKAVSGTRSAFVWWLFHPRPSYAQIHQYKYKTYTNTKHTQIQNIHKYKTYMSTNSNTNTDQIQNGNRNTNILADVYSNTDTDPTQMLISDKCIV